ncbi:MAG TPA: Rrf2 family transcriptional regulator [Methylophilaceae bacterium]|nr:Rrf2 family transcriptional regulator [Methylophilaceae bacterium]
MLYIISNMHLTQFSDIGLRLLMYLARETRETPAVTIAEISTQFGIPRNHMMKVAGKLARDGWIRATRGRIGGISLARASSEMRLGQIARALEGEKDLVECEKLNCRLSSNCELRAVLGKAHAAFYAALDEYTLEDIVGGATGDTLLGMHNGFLAIHFRTPTVSTQT